MFSPANMHKESATPGRPPSERRLHPRADGPELARLMPAHVRLSSQAVFGRAVTPGVPHEQFLDQQHWSSGEMGRAQGAAFRPLGRGSSARQGSVEHPVPRCPTDQSEEPTFRMSRRPLLPLSVRQANRCACPNVLGDGGPLGQSVGLSATGTPPSGWCSRSAPPTSLALNGWRPRFSHSLALHVGGSASVRRQACDCPDSMHACCACRRSRRRSVQPPVRSRLERAASRFP